MITWAEAKRQANLEKHGLDFADAHLIYDHRAKLTLVSTRKDENRLMDMTLVELAGAVLALVYVIRGKDVRVISLRRASRKERSIYEQAPK